MIPMFRILTLLLIGTFMHTTSFAQQSTAGNGPESEKKVSNNPPTSKIGFKKRSSVPVGKRTAPKRSDVVSGAGQISRTTKNPVGSTGNENSSKTLETIRIDYNNMPADVKSKVNANKAGGKDLLDGIVKVFTVEIKTCTTDADHKKLLSFLKAKKGFINSEFVSAGLLRIMVDPAFDSVDLKDVMLAEGIRFNFLSRTYLLKK